MRGTAKLFVCLLPGALLVTGCQKLDVKKTLSLEAGETKSVTVDAPKKDQKVTVSVKSSAAPVDVYLIQIKGATEEPDKLLEDKNARTILASQKQTQEATLDGTVPGGSKFAVVVAGAKKSTSVDVKITNAK